MKLKTLVHATLIGCAIISLAACSTTKKDPAQVADANGAAQTDANGVKTAGLGQGEELNGEGSETSRGHLAKNTYYFDYDKSDIHEEDRPAINTEADKLAAGQARKIVLEGHTDPRGSREYNVALGERRANAVADALRSRGVASHQIRVVSYGAERPASPGHDEESYQLDRRAHIVSVDHDQNKNVD